MCNPWEPDHDEEIITMENGHGVIEIGYQPLCKTAFSLKIDEILLRVPYPIEGAKQPHGYIFLNTTNAEANG